MGDADDGGEPIKKVVNASKSKKQLKAEEADRKRVWEEAQNDGEEILTEIQETHCIQHGNTRQRLRHGMKYSMYMARFSPDGSLLLTACSDKSVCLWDLSNGRELANYEHIDYTRCAIFSPDGLHVCTGCDDKQARVWKTFLDRRYDEDVKPLQTEPELTIPHRDWIMCVAYSWDGWLLATVSRDQSVKVHNLKPPDHKEEERHGSKRRSVSHAHHEHHHREGSKATAEEGTEGGDSRKETKRTSVAGGDHEPHEHKFHHMEVKLFVHEDQTWKAEFNSSNELLVTSSGWELGHAILFDVSTLDEVMRIPHPDWVISACFSPDYTMVMTTSRDKFCRVWKLPLEMVFGKARQDLKVEQERLAAEAKEAEAGIKTVRISKKKQKDMAEAAERAAIAATLCAEEIHKIGHTNWTVCASWSPDGKHICTGSDTGCTSIFSVETGEELHKRDQPEAINDVCWGLNGRKICISCDDGSARIVGGINTICPVPERKKNSENSFAIEY